MSDLDLLVIGDVNPDLILSGGDVQPRFGQVEHLVERADLVIGGSGAITACGAARLGLDVAICGVVGDDEFGRIMLGRLGDAGVDTTLIRIDPDLPTGVTVVLVRPADRDILTAPGAIRALGADDLERLPDRPARHVHTASYFLMGKSFRSSLPDAMRRFDSAGVTTSLDTNWDPSERWQMNDLLDIVDFLLPNEAELRAITGGLAVDDALRSFGERPSVAVKLGAHGAACRVGDSVLRLQAPDVRGFVDAIGAGDSFNAGYLAGVLDGRSPAEVLAMGLATGALSTRRAGGTAGQPDRTEAERLAATIR